MKIWNAFEGNWMINDADIEQYIEDLYQTLLADQQLIDKMEKTIEELKVVKQKKTGPQQKLTAEQRMNARKMRRAGVPLQEIAEEYKCSLPVIHRITKDIDVDLRKKGSQKAHIRKK